MNLNIVFGVITAFIWLVGIFFIVMIMDSRSEINNHLDTENPSCPSYLCSQINPRGDNSPWRYVVGNYEYQPGNANSLGVQTKSS